MTGSDQDSGISNNGNASEDSVDCSETVARQAQAMRRPEKRRRKALLPKRITTAACAESSECSEAKKPRVVDDELQVTNGDDDDDNNVHGNATSTDNPSEPLNDLEIMNGPGAGDPLELPTLPSVIDLST